MTLEHQWWLMVWSQPFLMFQLHHLMWETNKQSTLNLETKDYPMHIFHLLALTSWIPPLLTMSHIMVASMLLKQWQLSEPTILFTLITLILWMTPVNPFQMLSKFQWRK
jgi:hypothetical protein